MACLESSICAARRLEALMAVIPNTVPVTSAVACARRGQLRIEVLALVRNVTTIQQGLPITGYFPVNVVCVRLVLKRQLGILCNARFVQARSCGWSMKGPCCKQAGQQR